LKGFYLTIGRRGGNLQGPPIGVGFWARQSVQRKAPCRADLYPTTHYACKPIPSRYRAFLWRTHLTAEHPHVIFDSMMNRGWHVYACIATFFVVSTLGLSQISIYDRTPNARAAVEGCKTVLGYRLSPDARLILDGDSQVLIRLPSLYRKAVPQLLGMLQRGADIELFLDWVDPESEPGDFGHHIEIFRGRRGSEAALLHDFVLFGGPGGKVSFFQPSDARDTPTVLIYIQGGAYWGTTFSSLIASPWRGCSTPAITNLPTLTVTGSTS